MRIQVFDSAGESWRMSYLQNLNTQGGEIGAVRREGKKMWK